MIGAVDSMIGLLTQSWRSDAGVAVRQSRLHADGVELATGAHHAAMQGVLPGRHPRAILTRHPRRPHHSGHRTHQVVESSPSIH